jgi:hypothetical protein
MSALRFRVRTHEMTHDVYGHRRLVSQDCRRVVDGGDVLEDARAEPDSVRYRRASNTNFQRKTKTSAGGKCKQSVQYDNSLCQQLGKATETHRWYAKWFSLFVISSSAAEE